ncbi:hypothetical protein [Aliivibrio fischeri]|uniref:hypothetical protein n=1 Tax=Aliivibrio fischeri TaxID=668 RepID=UPI0012D8835E|nr:hypothetical protein [Aliivibrio fischeri]MUI54378.1 hypothetical protein [Aliivibrio fischeri]
MNFLQWQMLVSLVCFIISFMLSRGYLERPPEHGIELLESINVIVFIVGLLQSISASVQLSELNFRESEPEKM